VRLTRRLLLLTVLPWFCSTSPASVNVAAATPFSIQWTAPGDDGLVGRATAYELRYSNLPLNAANFGLATKLTGLPAPAIAGTQQSFVVSGLFDSLAYYFAIKTADEAGNWSGISNVMLRPASAPTLGAPGPLLSFSPPYPNPARESVRWSFSLPQAARVQVEVFDVLGRHVHTVENAEREAGAGVLAWDLQDEGGRTVGAGIYFVKARLGSNEWTKRLIVVR
jgi:hypothetical protein